MSTDLELRPEQTNFDNEQLAALRSLGVEDAPQGDVAMLFHLARRSGLDPFARQIYLIGRNQQVDGRWVKKYTIQTGIDGLRVLRDRTGKYQGHTTEWCGPDGTWRDVWLDRKPPVAARVTVYVKDRVVPQAGIALWDEYVQTKKDGNPTSMWLSKPSLMLAKCAEAIAYRQAFPQDFSGIYLEEEMQQADSEGPRPSQTVQPVIAATAGKPASKVRQTTLEAEPSAKEQGNLWLDRIMGAPTLEDLKRVWAQAVAEKATHLPTKVGMTVVEVKDARKEALQAVAAQDASEDAPALIDEFA